MLKFGMNRHMQGQPRRGSPSKRKRKKTAASVGESPESGKAENQECILHDPRDIYPPPRDPSHPKDPSSTSAQTKPNKAKQTHQPNGDT